MGFEPTTTCLGSKDSTTELRPLTVFASRFGSFIQEALPSVQGTPALIRLRSALYISTLRPNMPA